MSKDDHDLFDTTEDETTTKETAVSENSRWLSRRHRHRRRYTEQRPAAPTLVQETVFSTMRQRHLQRSLNGARKKASSFHAFALLLILASLMGVGVSSYHEGTLTTTLQIQFWQLLLTGFWFLVCSITLSTFAESKFFEAMVWFLVHWPLVATTTTLLFAGSTTITRYSWIFAGFLTAETCTLGIAVVIHYLYPRWLRSAWFQKHITAARFWSLRCLTDFTLTYKSGRRRHTCMYQGSLDPVTQLPHGYGVWRDEGGELLAGQWHQGEPMAPFRSRLVGTAAAVRAVPIVYVMATDDEVSRNRFIPTHENPSRVGVASVECSVQGVFYKHLPHVTWMMQQENEQSDDDDDSEQVVTVEACVQKATVERTTATPTSERLTIEVHGRRGVQVSGHVYEPTGLPFAEDTDKIVISIVDGQQQNRKKKMMEREEESLLPLLENSQKSIPGLSMPYSALSSSMDEMIYIPQDSSSDSGDELLHDSTTTTLLEATPQLHVHNWTAAPQKEALIYFSGFNSTLEKSLKNFGQFLAMTQVSEYVIPMVFCWPGGTALTYRYAAEMSATERNCALLVEFMQDIQKAGIRRVHFMSHSMGVQTLLHALHDTVDGERSALSKLFRLHHDFAKDDKPQQSNDHLLLCKSIIMINPDFPVEAFVNHSYLPLRRICGTITVIGDQSDQALFISQFFNGLFHSLGCTQPAILNPQGKALTLEEIRQRRGRFRYQRVIGRDFRMLHWPKSKGPNEEDVESNNSSSADTRLLFKVKTPMFVGADPTVNERKWLDIDVIDTTNLDANIMGLRHSGFNLNPTMLKDLEELIVTGRRAAERSSLLFREGNTYSYCHAPSFVSM